MQDIGQANADNGNALSVNSNHSWTEIGKRTQLLCSASVQSTCQMGMSQWEHYQMADIRNALLIVAETVSGKWS